MTILTRLYICLLALIFMVTTGFVQAQDTTQTVEDIVNSAQSSGAQIIVINPDSSKADDTPTLQEQIQKSFMMTAQERAVAFRTTLRNRIEKAPEALEEIIYILNGQSPSGHYSEYFNIFFWTILLLVISEIVVHILIFRPIVNPWLATLQREKPIGYSGKLPILLLRSFMAIVGLILVLLVSYGIGYMVFGESDNATVRLTVAYIYLGYFNARGIVFLWRMILTPYLPQYRIPHFSDQDAKRLYFWLLGIACLAITVVDFLNWIQELGIDYNVHALLSTFLTLVVVLLNVAMVLFNRKSISKAILNGMSYEDASFPARFAASAWVPAIIVYFFAAWAEMTFRLIEARPLGSSLISGFYFILLVTLVVYAIVGYLIERFFQRQRLLQEWQEKAASDNALEDDPEGEAEPEYSSILHTHKLRTFEDLSRRIANILALFAAFWAISQIWQIDIDMMSDSALSRSYDLIAILFIGYVIYHFVRIWIDHKIAEEGGEAVEVAPGDEGGAGGASRLATLLPLFRNFLLVVIFVTFALILLTNLGINVSALFAGAGVVGLAIGFGAQALVRDIFSGAFFLFDDAFRKGEYIDIGSVKGTVEKISVRSFQLRHHLGPLHTVPFGEIQHLTNFSRDWVMMKLPLRVTYDTDVEKVRKLIKKLGLELLEDPVVGDQFLQPLKSQGVIEMQDSAMIIRVKFMTKPGDQWILRKRVYAEIRDLFAREGIKFAHREVTVRLADGKADDLTPQQKEAVGAAALAAMDDDELPEIPGSTSDN